MLFRTHVMVAVCIAFIGRSYIPTGTVTSAIMSIPLVITFLIASVLPDIDTPNSFIGKRIPLISWPLKLIAGHRGIMHSVFIPLIGAALLFAITRATAYPLAFTAGYLLHLLLDSLTPAGIYPLSKIIPLRLRGPFKTGGIVDSCLFIGSFLIIGVVFIL